MGRHAAECGTQAGYQAHRRNGEEPCPACCAAYDQVWTPEEFARNRASVRALTRLAHLHAELLWTLYLEELRREGLGDGCDEEGGGR